MHDEQVLWMITFLHVFGIDQIIGAMILILLVKMFWKPLPVIGIAITYVRKS